MTPRPLTPSEKRTLLAIFAQHWENARHIKNERLSFTNIYAIVSAGILTLLHPVRSEPVLEVSLLVFLFAFSVIGLLTSLRLKAELEECLRNIERIVTQTGLEEFMPVISLDEVFRVPRHDGDRAPEIMMIIEAEGKRVAAMVDELLGQHQVVVKNLETNYRRVTDVSGATILGDGRVALIVDTASLVKRARH